MADVPVAQYAFLDGTDGNGTDGTGRHGRWRAQSSRMRIPS